MSLQRKVKFFNAPFRVGNIIHQYKGTRTTNTRCIALYEILDADDEVFYRLRMKNNETFIAFKLRAKYHCQYLNNHVRTIKRK